MEKDVSHLWVDGIRTQNIKKRAKEWETQQHADKLNTDADGRERQCPREPTIGVS